MMTSESEQGNVQSIQKDDVRLVFFMMTGTTRTH